MRPLPLAPVIATWASILCLEIPGHFEVPLGAAPCLVGVASEEIAGSAGAPGLATSSVCRPVPFSDHLHNLAERGEFQEAIIRVSTVGGVPGRILQDSFAVPSVAVKCCQDEAPEVRGCVGAGAAFSSGVGF